MVMGVENRFGRAIPAAIVKMTLDGWGIVLADGRDEAGTSGIVTQAPQPEMVEIPAGKFVMGSPEGEEDDFVQRPQHPVNIRRFAMSRHEATFAEYDAFALATGRDLPKDEGWGRDKRPVINVSWQDATDYAQWLSERTGKQYRLPTETEWEYAARAGTTTALPWDGDIKAACRHANVRDSKHADDLNARQGYTALVPVHFPCKDAYPTTAPVESFQVNSLGLYDMFGNVWEWVQDCWHGTYEGAPTDGTAWEKKECSSRVIRGGSWSYGEGLGSATRHGRFDRDGDIGLRLGDDIGFRLAQDL